MWVNEADTAYTKEWGRFEGFSLFALEALASGTPLVAFDIPSLNWASEKTILKAPSFDIQVFANQLIKIVEDQKLSTNMSVQARKQARAFSWDRVSRDYLDFVHRVIWVLNHYQ